MGIAPPRPSRFAFNPSILSFQFDVNSLTRYFVCNGEIGNKSVSIRYVRVVYLCFVSVQQWIGVIDIGKVSRSGDNGVIRIYQKFIKQAGKIAFGCEGAVPTEFLPVFPQPQM